VAGTLHVKRGDTVYVLAGKDRKARLDDMSSEQRSRLEGAALHAEAEKRAGMRAKVLQVLPDRRRVLVDGVNIVTKHARPRGVGARGRQMQTGRVQQPGAIDASNVMLICPRCDRPTKVIYRPIQAGSAGSDAKKAKRVRACRRCNEYIDEV